MSEPSGDVTSHLGDEGGAEGGYYSLYKYMYSIQEDSPGSYYLDCRNPFVTVAPFIDPLLDRGRRPSTPPASS